VAELLPARAEVLWQLGCTPAVSVPLDAHTEVRSDVPHKELEERIRMADLVIAHAGCGSAMTALAAGKLPLLVPRRCDRGENVDDHQVQLGGELMRRGLAVVRELDELTAKDMAEAAAGRVGRCPEPAAFQLAR
jgi:UDP-N-acetylglucosamine--N-acetylmuramyl-(pentapeptide) pyrophosphoryl-undecaprenol N-acetylglucosamine transferase